MPNKDLWRALKCQYIHLPKARNCARAQVLGIAAAKGDKWVSITIGTPFESYSKELMEILYSLEFQS